MGVLRVALCQINTHVGDLAGNVAKIQEWITLAEREGADVAVFPELTITGYPPEDLLLKPGFVADNLAALAGLADSVSGSCAAVVGFADGTGGSVFNAIACLAHGEVCSTYHKRALPNENVFDEKRVFRSGVEPMRLHRIAGVRVGMSICEDAWIAGGPVPQLAAGGAQVVMNVNASPYYRRKVPVRAAEMRARIEEAGGIPLVYVNQVGGQDELVFDGSSMVFDADGACIARAGHCVEELLVVDVAAADDRQAVAAPFPVVAISDSTGRERVTVNPRVAPAPDELDELHDALVVATRDYVHKNGFTDVCLGLSGGIDSTLTAAIAADALGPENVHAVLMPSRFSSGHSVTDAEDFASRLGISHRTIPIEPGHRAFLEMLAPSFAGRDEGLTEENIQARVRGVLLMALSNKFGWLVLTTGNKSEAAVGYSTLYGDTAGAYAVIKDVYKTDVYRLARRYNERAGTEIVPATIIDKAPSAELRPDQRDDQSLPPYDELDRLLQAYIEGDHTLTELIEMGFDDDVAKRITRLVDLSEFKRRQTPLGPRVTKKAFGRDRRLPITNGYA
ncbi:MAG: NAD+ synthase [Acidimicrobiia bacterium]|nr:NAD+ synthase [Acidimicrobiia bacterium]